MDNAWAACSGEDVIESSQVPNLRARKRKICYRESDALSAKRKSKPRNRSKAAPSTKPEHKDGSKSNTHNPAQPISGEFIEVPDTQSLFGGVETSVDLFKNQEKLVAQYIIQQNASMQQEEAELDRLLDGFRASYEAASKRVRANTPYSPKMVCENVATSTRQEKENVSLPIVAVAESRCTNRSNSRELPTNSSRSGYSDDTTSSAAERQRPVETQSELEEQTEPLNLSITQPAKKASFAFPCLVAISSTPKYPRALRPIVQPPSNVVKQREIPIQISPIQQRVSSTVTSVQEVGIQANIRPRYRNAGIQNRTDNCFEITRYNTMLLAREFGIDHERLRKKMIKICNMPVLQQQPLLRERNVHAAFTSHDPYYARLDFFMKERSSRLPWE
ncbi:uncharacterized protein LOC118467146 [Anopheles albimanus]|uniref:Uncharacterized protein n=1 Tax=Anopheles albimanus TaxID=7167 RepID=A0A182FY03_ANOAL|nr:uncharacterized protein LOC118467146 [Anopheles albimanus]